MTSVYADSTTVPGEIHDQEATARPWKTDHAPTAGAEPGGSWTGCKEPVHDDPPDPRATQPEPEALSAVAEQGGPTEPQSEQETAIAPAPLHGGGVRC